MTVTLLAVEIDKYVDVLIGNVADSQFRENQLVRNIDDCN
jgi:hypothetical protein